MKKFTLLLFVFATAGVFAQKGFHLGVIAGPQITEQLNQQDFDNSDVKYNGLTVRAGYGVTFNYHFTDKIGLGTQVFFSYQGLKYENRLGTQFFRKTNYLKIPLLFHVNSTAQKLVGGYMYIGPEINFLIYKDLKVNDVSLKKTGNQAAYDTYAGLHRPFTAGGVLGFGIVFNILKGRLQANLGLRLDGELMDAYKGKDMVAVPIGNKYLPFDGTTGIFPVDENTGKRTTTYNVSGMVELGVKWVFLKK